MKLYRCYYHPVDRYGAPVPNPSGSLPSVDIEARSQAEAERLAFAKVKAPIAETERLQDEIVVAKPKRKRAASRPKLESLGLTTAAALLERSTQ